MSGAPRTCDSCFAHKVRCIYGTGEYTCDRCMRLGKSCVRRRPAPSIGRRKLLPDRLLEPVRHTQAETARQLHQFRLSSQALLDLDLAEEFVIRNLSNARGLEVLTIDHKLTVAMHEEVMRTLLSSYAETRDAFFSAFLAFAAASTATVPEYDATKNFQLGKLALQSFCHRAAPVTRPELVPWLWCGLNALLFARCAVGWNASPVRRHILSHILALGERGQCFRTHPMVITLIAVDIYESLLYQSMPIMNIPECDMMDMGSFMGMCMPLLRFLFELCRLRALSRSHGLDAAGREALSNIQASLWTAQPVVDHLPAGAPTATEMTHLLSQFRVQKAMILLCIHRSVYDDEEGDSLAEQMAKSILSDLDLATTLTGGPPRSVTMPFIIAAIEARTPEDQALFAEKVSLYVGGASPKTRADLSGFLQSSWSERRSSRWSSWSATMARVPALCISI